MIVTLEMIKELIRSQNRVVKYEKGFTICPICEMAGISESVILVGSTVGEIRYCSCETCGGNFRAAGEITAKKSPESVKVTAKTDKDTKAGHNIDKDIKKVKPKKTRKKKAKASKKAKKEVNNE